MLTTARVLVTGAGANAAAEPKRAMDIREKSFMVTVLIDKDLYFVVRLWDSGI